MAITNNGTLNTGISNQTAQSDHDRCVWKCQDRTTKNKDQHQIRASGDTLGEYEGQICYLAWWSPSDPMFVKMGLYHHVLDPHINIRNKSKTIYLYVLACLLHVLAFVGSSMINPLIN